MADHKISIEQIEDLVLSNVPSKEEQQRMVQEIESMIEQGINADRAVESVFGKSQIVNN